MHTERHTMTPKEAQELLRSLHDEDEFKRRVREAIREHFTVDLSHARSRDGSRHAGMQHRLVRSKVHALVKGTVGPVFSVERLRPYIEDVLAEMGVYPSVYYGTMTYRGIRMKDSVNEPSSGL